ncbi:metallophosphoesterase [Nostoc sp. CCY0012]|uniref:metallophosphoesterase n=1 Tax=Nostoc sp. CCY0012 TaxID=1056123 RepID=UPI0039C5AB6E
MSKSKIVVLSDIHIGTNAPTVWYQKDLHEPYLVTVLDWVINNASSVKELILLGDIIDFWTYPPHEEPPSFDAIMAANPNLFGADGKLSEVMTALEGKVTYVRGNHDMTITQEDLDKIQNPQGYKIKLSPGDIYYPLVENKKIVCTHGHIYTMFNAPFYDSNPIAPLPLGQFITRAVAFMRSQQLKPGETVADLKDSGDPGGWDIFPGIVEEIKKVIPDLLSGSNPQVSLSGLILDVIARSTQMSETQTIKLAHGQETTLQEGKSIYANLWTQWKNKEGKSDAIKAIVADINLHDVYLAWFAQKLAHQQSAELVVMGHTHKPISGIKDFPIQYVNTGFNCPSKPDMGKKHPTFVQIDVEKSQGEIWQIIKEKDTYKVDTCFVEPIDNKAKINMGQYEIELTIDPIENLDLILKLLTYDKNYIMEVVNKTKYNLKYSGVKNDSGIWTLRDIPARTSLQEIVEETSTVNTFSFGANYQVEGGSGFIQFSASWPTIGRRKINVGNINQSGDEPAKKVWDNMNDANDKSCSNDSVKVRAFLKEEGKTIIWFYEVSEK